MIQKFFKINKTGNFAYLYDKKLFLIGSAIAISNDFPETSFIQSSLSFRFISKY